MSRQATRLQELEKEIKQLEAEKAAAECARTEVIDVRPSDRRLRYSKQN